MLLNKKVNEKQENVTQEHECGKLLRSFPLAYAPELPTAAKKRGDKASGIFLE